MSPIRLTLDGNIEILVSAASSADEAKARFLAQVIARNLGLARVGDHAPPRTGGTPLAKHKLERVQAFVEEHLAARLRVEQLAAVVHMSPFHFTRLFKQATGLSPHAYLTWCRVERAKRILAHSRVALVDVAACVGFQTQGHFTEVFRRHAGTTPRRFRNAALTGEPAQAPAVAQES